MHTGFPVRNYFGVFLIPQENQYDWSTYIFRMTNISEKLLATLFKQFRTRHSSGSRLRVLQTDNTFTQISSLMNPARLQTLVG